MFTSLLVYSAGVALLAVPSGLARPRALSYKSLDELVDRPHPRLGLVNLFNLLDLFRGYAGVTLLQTAFVLCAKGVPGSLTAQLTATGTVLATVVTQHAFHKTDPYELVAPVGYLLGVGFALLPPIVMLLAWPLGVAAALASRNICGGLVSLAGATALLGGLLHPRPVAIAGASLAFILPCVLACVLQRQLVISTWRKAGFDHLEPLRETPATATRC